MVVQPRPMASTLNGFPKSTCKHKVIIYSFFFSSSKLTFFHKSCKNITKIKINHQMCRHVREKVKELAEDYHLEIAPTTNKSNSKTHHHSTKKKTTNKKSNSSSPSRLLKMFKQTNALNFIYIHNNKDDDYVYDNYDSNDKVYHLLFFLLELSTITSNVIARTLLYLRWTSLKRISHCFGKVKILIRCKCLKILDSFLSV